MAKKKKPRNKNYIPGRPKAPLVLPVTSRDLTYKELEDKLKALVPHLKQVGFEDLVITGYRRVPESELNKYGGVKVVPYNFRTFKHLFQAAAVMQWGVDDISRALRAEALRRKQVIGKEDSK